MYTQIEVPVDGNFTPFWQHDSIEQEEYCYSLGLKEFIDLGQFKYHWTLQGLTREDVEQLVTAGQRLLDMTKGA